MEKDDKFEGNMENSEKLGKHKKTCTEPKKTRRFAMRRQQTIREEIMQAEKRIVCELEEKHLKKRKTLRVWKLWMTLSQLKLKSNGSQTVKSVTWQTKIRMQTPSPRESETLHRTGRKRSGPQETETITRIHRDHQGKVKVSHH